MSSNQAADHVGDKYWGKGGRYVVNPLTGERELADQADSAPDTIPVATDAGTGEFKQTAVEQAKGKHRG